MKNSTNFWGLLALGVCIILSVNKFTGTKRVVNVKGLATQEVMADHVIWPLVIQDVDNDLVKLYSTMVVAGKRNKGQRGSGCGS